MIPKMKRIIIVFMFMTVNVMVAQAFKGKGDVKFQVGANVQQNGTGIMGSIDYGLGENISIGIASVYLLGVDKIVRPDGTKVPVAEFEDRFDFKARFSANLGNVINIDDALDIYPGLHVSLKNFGGHLGGRYFFTSGFGVFAELNIPFAKYKTETLTPPEQLHNQFSLNAGATFNLN